MRIILGHSTFINTVDKIFLPCDVEFKCLKFNSCSFFEIYQNGEHSNQCSDFCDKIQIEEKKMTGDKEEVKIVEKIQAQIL